MNNEELKKKIVDILQLKLQECPLQPHGIMYRDAAEYIADALIAAGIGDVKEAEKEYRDAIFLAVTSQTMTSERSRYIELNKNIAEHRAEVAERALRYACWDLTQCYGAKVRQEWADLKAAQYKNKAEKELAEENSGKKEV